MSIKSMFRFAALLELINALLHLGAFIPNGFDDTATQLVPAGFVHLLLAFFLYRAWRWAAWLQLVISALTGVTAIVLWSGFTLPEVWMALIILLDFAIAATCLTIIIRRFRGADNSR